MSVRNPAAVEGQLRQVPVGEEQNFDPVQMLGLFATEMPVGGEIGVIVGKSVIMVAIIIMLVFIVTVMIGSGEGFKRPSPG